MIDENFLMKIFNDVKHHNLILNENLIEKFICELSDKNLGNREVGLVVRCLALGSNYLEKNPTYFKSFFKKEMPDGALQNIFKAMKYSNIEHFYLEELERYSKLETFLNNHSIDAESALNTLSSIGNDNERFDRIELKINEAITYLGKNNAQKESVMEYIDVCFKILLKIIMPQDWYSVDYCLEIIIKDYNVGFDWKKYILSICNTP